MTVRCDAERLRMQDAEDKYCHLVTKMQFDCTIHGQQVADLNDRLANQKKYTYNSSSIREIRTNCGVVA